MSPKLTPLMRRFLTLRVLNELGYKNLKFLGQGSYNTVFKCNNKSNELVAAKVVMANSDDDYDVEALNTEIGTSDQLEKMKPINWEKYKDSFFKINPSVAKRAKHYFKYFNRPVSKGACSNSDFQYAVFEAPLIKGDMWDTFVESEDKSVNIEELKKVAKNILKALVVLHSQGRVHLDIKPHNIFRAAGAKGKDIFQLGDFGLLDATVGRDGSDNTENVIWKVTDWYKAPEQVKKLNSIGIKLKKSTFML